MSDVWIAAGAALAGTLIGASISIVQLIINYRRERDVRYEDLLVMALQHLDDSEFRRSVGISILEGLHARGQRFSDITLPTLVNQAVYLLLHTDNKNSRCEFHNWLRIMELLGDPITLKDKHFDAYGEITNAFMIKDDASHVGGLDMPKETLHIWAKKFGFDLSIP